MPSLRLFCLLEKCSKIPPLPGPVLVLLLTVISPLSASAVPRYSVSTEGEGTSTVYLLRDQETSASARVHPSLGGRCVSLALPGPDGILREVLASPSPFRRPGSTSSLGIPILFPWPGVVAGGRYLHERSEYRLSDSVGRTTQAMHGFVERRPWAVKQAEADQHGARVTCSISSTSCPEHAKGYPFDWVLSVTYELTSAGLALQCEVTNPGARVLPFGLGLHPWFRMPFHPFGRLEDCLIQLPAARIWNQDLISGLLPPGANSARAPSTSWTLACSTADDLSSLTKVKAGETKLYTDLRTSGSWVTCRLADPWAKLETLVEFTPNFGTAVVFKPRGGRLICIEPWTCPPNAFNLAAHNSAAADVVLLRQNGSWRGEMRVRLAPLPGDGGR